MPNMSALGRLQSRLRALEERGRAQREGDGEPASLSQAATEAGAARGIRLGRQRVSEWLGRGPRSSVPRDADTLLALVEVWTGWAKEEFDQESRLAWLRLWEDTQDALAADPGRTRLGRTVAKLSNPLDYEVLPAISAPGRESDGRTEHPSAPAYLLRPADDTLRAALDDPQRSVIVCVVGAPASGKTRACWEAVREQLPTWHLWHPVAPSPALCLLDGIRSGNLTRRTVLWLNEAADYLTGPTAEETATALREALRSPVLQPLVVLCTFRPETFKALTSDPAVLPGSEADGSHPSHVRQVTRLLSMAQTVAMPDCFMEEHVQRLRQHVPEDQRVAEAVHLAPEGRITQYLAGCLALLDRYKTASAPEKAVLESAMDLRRLGLVPSLPGPLLEATASALLSPEDHAMLPADWFHRAVTELRKPRRGLPGPLTCSAPQPYEDSEADRYRLADPLARHGATERVFRVPPDAWWQAAARTAQMPTALFLGDAAQVRGRFCHAAPLYRRAADSGTALGLLGPTSLAEARKEWQEAETHSAAFRAAGGIAAVEQEIRAYEENGEMEIAQALDDRTEGIFGLSDSLASGMVARFVQGFQTMDTDAAAAKAIFREHYEESGDPAALAELASLYMNEDDLATAKELLLKAAREGVPCFADLADLFEVLGDEQLTLRYRNAAAADGDLVAIWDLAELYHTAGTPDWAEECLLEAARLGAWWCWELAAEWRVEAGEPDEAEHLLVRAIEEEGHLRGHIDLGRIHEGRGRFDAALDRYRTAWHLGLGEGLALAVRLLEENGRRQDANSLVEQARAANDLNGLDALMRHYLTAGRLEEAESLCLVLERYEPEAASVRADIAERRGDISTAVELYSQAAKAGDAGAVERLAMLYDKLDEPEQLEAACRRLLDAGGTDALAELVLCLGDQGRRREADALRRWGVDAQGRPAKPWDDTWSLLRA